MPPAEKMLIAIGGPTAAGKTALSIRLAQKFQTEILSFDSRQFYREMEIGTAKPTPEELEAVPHHFINSHSIHEEYSAGRFATDARKLLSELFKHHDIIVAVGGSGLYLRALSEGLPQMPEIKPEIRDELNRTYRDKGLDDLLQELRESDPEYFEKVDRQNPVRIIRALEVIRGSGQQFSHFRQGTQEPLPWRTVKIVWSPPREILYQRIDQRVQEMMEAGLEEDAHLLHPLRGLNALETVGYKELFDYFEGKYDRQEAIRLIARNTRRYAKRQLTWFRKERDTQYFVPGEEEQLEEWLENEL